MIIPGDGSLTLRHEGRFQRGERHRADPSFRWIARCGKSYAVAARSARDGHALRLMVTDASRWANEPLDGAGA